MTYFLTENEIEMPQQEESAPLRHRPSRMETQTDKVLEMQQLINVRYNVYITDHATLRYMERMKITWDDLLLNSDFAQQTLYAILKKM